MDLRGARAGGVQCDGGRDCEGAFGADGGGAGAGVASPLRTPPLRPLRVVSARCREERDQGKWERERLGGREREGEGGLLTVWFITPLSRSSVGTAWSLWLCPPLLSLLPAPSFHALSLSGSLSFFLSPSSRPLSFTAFHPLQPHRVSPSVNFHTTVWKLTPTTNVICDRFPEQSMTRFAMDVRGAGRPGSAWGRVRRKRDAGSCRAA
eukprot:288694-Rhodomonas_salina.3